jgi:hypothetical protein
VILWRHYSAPTLGDGPYCIMTNCKMYGHKRACKWMGEKSLSEAHGLGHITPFLTIHGASTDKRGPHSI